MLGHYRNSLIPTMVMLLVGIAGCQTQHAATESALYRPSVMPDRIVLSWTDTPAHSEAVTWRTDTSITTAVAQIATADSGTNIESRARTVPAVSCTLATDLWRTHYHSVTFGELKSDTLYAYRVGDGTHWSEWLQFRTASDQSRPFSFIYFGDVQKGIRPLWSRVLREAFRAAPDAKCLVFGGDLVSDGASDTQWGELFSAGDWLYGMIPVLPSPGNHEYKKDKTGRWTLSRHWRVQFALPENGPEGLKECAYYVDCQGTRIISLNSIERITEQAAWLDRVLSSNPNRWTIVTFHYPIFSSAEGHDKPQLRAAWKPILDKHSVDLVLTGHDHTYARSSLDGQTVYVTSVSGAKMYRLERKPWMVRAAEGAQLFQVITVGPDCLSFEARTADGKLYDAFELKKQKDGSKILAEQVPIGVPRRLPLQGIE